MGLGFVFIILHNLTYMEIPRYMKKLLNEITGTNQHDSVLYFSAIALVYTFLTALFMFLMRKLMIGASRKIEFEIRQEIYEKLLVLDIDFFNRNKTGDISSRCTNDLNDVRTLLGPGLMYVPNSISRFLIFLPVMLALSPLLMGITSALLVFLVTLIVLVMPKLRPLYLKIQESTGLISNRAWQIISGISSIKLHNMENAETSRFKSLNETYIKDNMSLAKWRGFLWPFFMFTFGISELLILYFGGKQIIEGKMNVGELLQFNIMIAYLTFPILSLGWILSLVQQGISAMERLSYILNEPVSNEYAKNELKDKAISIEFKECTFTYPGSESPALKQFSFDFKSGQTIGITGTIGSGKSTIIQLLTGIFTPPGNTVFINGKDIQTLKKESVFNVISVVPQEPFLFSRTLKENIALGLSATESEDNIKKAIHIAGLSQDVESFTLGEHEIVGERGITLSGGQKQRTAIARAILKKSPVTVMDDALSSVDAATEETILENLKEYIQSEKEHSKLFIIVSHRISALKHTDKILVMEHGELTEQGSHEELMKFDGLYARLAKIQQLGMGFDL